MGGKERERKRWALEGELGGEKFEERWEKGAFEEMMGGEVKKKERWEERCVI